MEVEGHPSSIRHISGLDGLRGVAVAGVLLFHGGHLRGGYLGVDLFFTLSGFLITSLLLAESSKTGNVGLGGFWARRARRLLPALCVLLVGVVLYCLLVATPQELAQIRGDGLATLAYVANWRAVFSHQNYFALFSAPSPLQHTWSLAIEEQFYLIWPLVFVALLARFKRNTPRAVLTTSLVLAAVSSVLMITLYRSDNTTRAYYGTDTRAAAILLGAALAAWLAIHGPTSSGRRRIQLEATGFVGAIVLVIAWTRLDGESRTLYHGGFLVCGLAATAVIAAVVHPRPSVLSRTFSWKPLCQLGLISYGVYLYHWPIDIVLDQKRVGLTGWPLFAVQTIVTLAVAIASYRIVEQPIRHGAVSAIQWRKLTPAIGVGLVVALVAATLGAKPEPTFASTLRHPLLSAARAYQAASPSSTRVLIVGNSVAAFLGPGFKAVTAKPTLAVLDDGITACHFPPELTGLVVKARGIEVPESPCDPSWEAGVVARFHPNIVFWILSGPSGVGKYHGQTLHSCTAPYDALYRQRLKEEVAILGAGGAHVIVVTAAYSRYFGAQDSDALTDCDNQLRRDVAAATGVQLVDLAKYICPTQKCRAEQDGVTLRPDGLHYTGKGGQIVAGWLVDQARNGSTHG